MLQRAVPGAVLGVAKGLGPGYAIEIQAPRTCTAALGVEQPQKRGKQSYQQGYAEEEKAALPSPIPSTERDVWQKDDAGHQAKQEPACVR